VPVTHVLWRKALTEDIVASSSTTYTFFWSGFYNLIRKKLVVICKKYALFQLYVFIFKQDSFKKEIHRSISSYEGQRIQVAYPCYRVLVNLFARQCGCFKSSRYWNVSSALRNETFYGYYEYVIARIARRIKYQNFAQSAAWIHLSSCVQE
jgi:hypothetical protein